MRILVLGAGAVGGYFGGRLLEAGKDVTFLVRPGRAALLAEKGLVIQSPEGNVRLEQPPTVTDAAQGGPSDLILLSCKAYDLDSARAAIAPAVGKNTMILPLLNGQRHLEKLDARFGAEKILGGLCLVSATVGENGEIIHFLPGHRITFGERSGELSARTERVETAWSGARFEVVRSPIVRTEMWEKWVMLAALAGATTLMRASIGAIARAPGGEAFVLGLLEECRRVAEMEGSVPRPESFARMQSRLTNQESTLTASMYRDICHGGWIESEQIIGDLLVRGEKHGHGAEEFPLLGLVRTHLRAYENQQTAGA